MIISDILKTKKPSISFEFFPPKSEDLEAVLFETIDSLKEENGDFASVTFGAGGSFAEKTLEWTKRIKESCRLATMMHITCVGFHKNNIDDILNSLKAAGIENILALRGDMPKETQAASNPQFKYAADLVKYISARGDFCIGVAGYPEGHPETPDINKDIQNLKLKVESGADFIISQLFFDNDAFFRFRDNLGKLGVHKPIVAGIMPIVNASQVVRFTKMCGTSIPKNLLGKIENKTDADVMKIGVEYAARQCDELVKNEIDGLHFYTLNRSAATKDVLRLLGKKG